MKNEKDRLTMAVDPAWLAGQFPSISNLAALGQGGQKEVYSGTHSTDGEVVLKLFHVNADPDRARREVDAVLKIQSPRVPPIFETGTVNSAIGEMIWLREKRLNGHNLRERLGTGALETPAVLRLGLHVAEALAAAENSHIVHRDVKPDNILLDQDGNFWLLDFGLARHLDEESLTATGALYGVGTLGYAPTEQFRNRKEEIDARADLFGLGVTLYECVEGVNPFRHGARDRGEILRRIENQPLLPIVRQIDPGTEFRDLVQAMTRTRRDHRPQNVAEALRWMQEICRANGIS